MSVKQKKTHTFRIEYTTDEGDVLEGTFTCKRLSIMDRTKVGVRKSQLSGGMYCVRDDDGVPTGQGLNEDTDFMNTIIAHLEQALIQKPTWWDLDDISDVGVLREVYDKVLDFESTFFRSRDRKAEQPVNGRNSSEGGPTELQETYDSNGPTPVVDKKVPAALDA